MPRGRFGHNMLLVGSPGSSNPLLDTVCANTYADLNPGIVIDHLRARATTEATAVVDAVSSRVVEAQRFAGARFREVLEVARRNQRLKATSLGTN